MGYPQRREAVRKAGGDWEQYDYSKCARAQIFARDHAKDIFEVMRCALRPASARCPASPAGRPRADAGPALHLSGTTAGRTTR